MLHRIVEASGRTPDAYSAAAAAQVLGVSERRVRQLVTADSLPALSLSPLRVPQDAVHRERDRRRRSPPRTSARSAPAGPPEEVDIEALVERTGPMTNEGGPALTADGLTVDNGLFLTRLGPPGNTTHFGVLHIRRVSTPHP